MKRGTPDHPKTRRLMRILGLETWAACGLLEVLWHFTAKHAIRGDVGRWTNEEIAEGIGWGGDAGKLIDALIESRWLERDETHRLIVHDWHEHCDDSVTKTIKNRGEKFLSVRCVSGNVATFPENSGNGRPSQALPSPAKPKPSQASPPATSRTMPDGNGWAAVAEELANEGISEASVRPEDESVQPEDIMQLLGFFRKHTFAADEPLAVLHRRIRDHTPSLSVNRGWKAKFTKRETGPPIDTKTQAKMRELKSDQDKALAELETQLANGGAKRG